MTLLLSITTHKDMIAHQFSDFYPSYGYSVRVW